VQKRTTPINLLVAQLPSASEILPWLVEIDKTRQYTNFGPLCQRLARDLAALTRVQCVVCLSSCTLGLELALRALNLPDGATVLVPALTFPATATAIVRSGLKPFFSDVDETSLTLTPNIARAAAAESAVEAVLTVALHGYSANIAEWDAFTAETGIPVLVDAAGAIAYQQVGSTTSAVFSLHATKPLAVGEGGFVATNSPALAHSIKIGANFGFDSGQVRRAGTNAKMSEFHAAVGLAALTSWDEKRRRREQLFQQYVAGLRRPELNGRSELVTVSGSSPNVCIRIIEGVGLAFIENLCEDGIETRRWYWPPLHRHPAFLAYTRFGDLAVTERVSDQLLGLPFHLELTAEDINRVTDALAIRLR
jgi:dTDP-4-amino-4,6-dideoxygalactose transaminase